MPNIKPGYQIHINSWENDCDNFKTIIVSGLTLNEVIDHIVLCKMFYSGNLNKGCYGNQHIDNIDFSQMFDSFSVCSNWFENKNQMFDKVMHLIGDWCEGEYTRVFDSFKVYYIPQEIEDVTGHFIS